MPEATPAPATPPSSPIKKRDPEKTRQQILEAGSKVFARAGFEGAHLSEILREADVNKRMIYHYFENKEGLYQQVHENLWSELHIWIETDLKKNDQDLGPKELLIQMLESVFDFMVANPRFVRLISWDGLEGGRMVKNIWKDARGPIFRSVEGIMVEAQKKGLLRPEIDPTHLVLSILGALTYFFNHEQNVGILKKKKVSRKVSLENRKKQIIQLLSCTFVDS